MSCGNFYESHGPSKEVAIRMSIGSRRQVAEMVHKIQTNAKYSYSKPMKTAQCFSPVFVYDESE